MCGLLTSVTKGSFYFKGAKTSSEAEKPQSECIFKKFRQTEKPLTLLNIEELTVQIRDSTPTQNNRAYHICSVS